MKTAKEDEAHRYGPYPKAQGPGHRRGERAHTIHFLGHSSALEHLHGSALWSIYAQNTVSRCNSYRMKAHVKTSLFPLCSLVFIHPLSSLPPTTHNRATARTHTRSVKNPKSKSLLGGDHPLTSYSNYRTGGSRAVPGRSTLIVPEILSEGDSYD
jgi:hypothetical protein